MSQDNQNQSCVIIVPSPRIVDQGFEEALFELQRRGYPVWRPKDRTGVQNVMAVDALSAGFSEQMWINPAVLFHPNDVDRFRTHAVPLVCSAFAIPGKRGMDCDFLPDVTSVRFGLMGDLIEVKSSSLGFALIHRGVFEAIRHKHQHDIGATPVIPFFSGSKAPNDSEWEDGIGFCAQARECGFKVMVDTVVRTWRVAPYPYGWEDAGGRLARFPDYTLNISEPLRSSSNTVSTSQAPETSAETPPKPTAPPNSFRGKATSLPPWFPVMRVYIPTYPANRDSLLATLEDFRKCDWGEEPLVIEQPAEWPKGRDSASRNYKRIFERTIEDGCDFALILEDDVRVCRHLRHNLCSIPLVQRDQCDYFSLFMPDLIANPWIRSEPHLGYRLARPLYVGPDQGWEKFRIWGSQAYLLSRRFILAALEQWDRLRSGQDSRVLMVCSKLGAPLWYSAPCLVEHAPIRSAFSTPSTYAPDFNPDFKVGIGSGFQPPEAIPGWLTLEECRLVAEVAADRAVFELGTAGGRSTVSLAQTAKKVLTIDVLDQTEATEWVRRYGLSNRVEFRQGNVVEICHGLNGEFGMGLINAEENPEFLHQKIEALLPRLTEGGLVAIHNYPDPKWPHIRKIVDDFVNRMKWKRVAQAGYLGVFQI
jgi:hypothetical protein